MSSFCKCIFNFGCEKKLNRKEWCPGYITGKPKQRPSACVACICSQGMRKWQAQWKESRGSRGQGDGKRPQVDPAPLTARPRPTYSRSHIANKSLVNEVKVKGWFNLVEVSNGYVRQGKGILCQPTSNSAPGMFPVMIFSVIYEFTTYVPKLIWCWCCSRL